VTKDLEGISKATRDLEGISKATKDLEGISKVTRDLEGISKATRDLEGISKPAGMMERAVVASPRGLATPHSLRGCPHSLAVLHGMF